MTKYTIFNKVQDYVAETNNKQSDTISFKNKQCSRKGKSVSGSVQRKGSTKACKVQNNSVKVSTK